MAFQRHPVLTEIARQLFDQVDRAVLAARAADGDGDIAAVVSRQGVEPVVRKCSMWLLHLLDIRGCWLQKGGHGLVAPGQVAQPGS